MQIRNLLLYGTISVFFLFGKIGKSEEMKTEERDGSKRPEGLTEIIDEIWKHPLKEEKNGFKRYTRLYDAINRTQTTKGGISITKAQLYSEIQDHPPFAKDPSQLDREDILILATDNVFYPRVKLIFGNYGLNGWGTDDRDDLVIADDSKISPAEYELRGNFAKQKDIYLKTVKMISDAVKSSREK